MEWILAALLTLLQLVDLILTGKIIKAGGREVWPTTKWLIERLGTWPALLMCKVASVAGIVVIASLVPQVNQLLILLYLLTVIYGFVCAHNWSVWKNVRKYIWVGLTTLPIVVIF
jgi:hypothetical protein